MINWSNINPQLTKNKHSFKKAKSAKPKIQKNNSNSRFTASKILTIQRSMQNQMVYPQIAQRMGWQGNVVVEVSVLADGHLLQAIVKKSSGYEVLDKQVLQALQNWEFAKGHQQESFTLEFDFSLN